MFGNHFYNETTRRYVAVFGTLFNDIQIERRNAEGVVHSKMKVPINYAPIQKILARLEGDPDLSAPAMTLPRMSFEITGMNYAPERKVNSTLRYRGGSAAEANSLITRTVPAPYDIEFQLNIMTKYNEDATRILEQIIPFFKPDITPSVKLLDDLDMYLDIPIILNSTSMEDSYEADFLTRRALIYTLSFTMRGYFFGPNTNKKMIKFAKANVSQPLTATSPSEFVSAQPGLTANGTPTTSLSQTVDYSNINIDDNWDYVVVVDDADE
jgi:hypothetical protein